METGQADRQKRNLGKRGWREVIRKTMAVFTKKKEETKLCNAKQN